MHNFLTRTVTLALLVVAIASSLIAYRAIERDRVPHTGTPYQAFALMNGQVFFGRLEAGDYSDSFLILHDVFYVQTRQNPETKAVANVLVKRGGEAHQPDSMVINRQQVLLIEPVKPESAIGQLIAQQRQSTP